MLQFRDCPHCGKRIRVEATRCHRCNSAISDFDTLTDEAEDSESHVATGGYSEDDFDYDQFVEQEFGQRSRRLKPFWYWLTWLMIALMVLTGVFAFVEL